jgi:nucleoside phosphorylase
MKESFKNILIVSAMQQELRLLLTEFNLPTKSIPKGSSIATKYKGCTIHFGVTGIGGKRAEEKFTTILRHINHIDFVLLVGICGAVDPTLCVGDIVIPQAVMNDHLSLLSTHSFAMIAQKGILFSAQKLCGFREKQALVRTHEAITAVDMEAFFIVKKAHEKNIPVFIVKTVSDALTFSFPAEKLIQEGLFRMSFLKSIYAVMRTPIDFFKLITLRKHIKKAFEKNAAYVASFLRSEIWNHL